MGLIDGAKFEFEILRGSAPVRRPLSWGVGGEAAGSGRDAEVGRTSARTVILQVLGGGSFST